MKTALFRPLESCHWWAAGVGREATVIFHLSRSLVKGYLIADARDRQVRVATRLCTPVLSASGGSRPKPVTGPYEIIALKLPFAAWGKLRPRFMESSLICKERTNAIRTICPAYTTVSSPS